jgi:hypothetical protein
MAADEAGSAEHRGAPGHPLPPWRLPDSVLMRSPYLFSVLNGILETSDYNHYITQVIGTVEPLAEVITEETAAA